MDVEGGLVLVLLTDVSCAANPERLGAVLPIIPLVHCECGDDTGEG